jgi:DNA repair exonuclease SbcCD ATPase subunit
LKSQLTKEIKRLEQEHRTISQDYSKQLDVIKKIDNDLKKPKDDDDKKALELRKTVADKEKDKLLDKLNKTEDLQNKYDDRLRELTKSAPSAATSASSTKKKPPPESDSDETVASVSDIKIKDIFDRFMKDWQTDVLSTLSDEQLRTYVQNFTVEDMKDWFMEDGKKLKLIGPNSNRKSPKVVGVFDLMDKRECLRLKPWLMR